MAKNCAPGRARLGGLPETWRQGVIHISLEFSASGRGLGKESSWGFPACAGDEQGLVALNVFDSVGSVVS